MLDLRDLRKFHYYDIIVATSLSVLANALLLFLIIYKTPANLKPYSKILLQTCLFDTLLACITFITKTQVALDSGVVVMVLSGSLANIPQPINFLLMMLYLYFFYFCIISLPIPFYYRYLIICKNTVLSYFRLTCLYFIAALFTLSLVIFMGFVFLPNDQKSAQYMPIMNQSFWLDELGQVPTFVAADLTNPFLLGMLLYLAILNSTTYILVLYFIRKIMKKLTSLKSIMSSKSQNLQKQINYALIAQALCPLLTASIPICLTAITIVLNLNIAEISGILVQSAISWITFFNPIIMILVITPYRRSLTCRKKQIAPSLRNGPTGHTSGNIIPIH